VIDCTVATELDPEAETPTHDNIGWWRTSYIRMAQVCSG
jgi:hypothetical protein